MVLKYLFIGVIFTFIIELLINNRSIQNHPKVKKAFKNANFGMQERVLNILIWPITLFIFLFSFLKEFFR